MKTQPEKCAAFAALHARKGAFVIPNPWDAGSARLLEHLGFQALATTSAGYAFSCGNRDNTTGREATLAHASVIVAATDLPVSADLENCFGDAPEIVAETIRLAAQTGLAGGSVEDSTGRAGSPQYELTHAADRVRAAAQAAHSLPFPFTLTARAENYLVGRPDLKDAIARLQSYQQAGADVLYAPGLTTLEDVAAVVRAVDRPVNVLAGAQFSVAALAEIGVRRISAGGALARAAYGAFLLAAREMKEHGTFRFAEQAISYREISAIFAELERGKN